MHLKLSVITFLANHTRWEGEIEGEMGDSISLSFKFYISPSMRGIMSFDQMTKNKSENFTAMLPEKINCAKFEGKIEGS